MTRIVSLLNLSFILLEEIFSFTIRINGSKIFVQLGIEVFRVAEFKGEIKDGTEFHSL